jgi:hypothetical protein
MNMLNYILCGLLFTTSACAADRASDTYFTHHQG